MSKKTDVMSQNTGANPVSVSNADDTRPYEQKNMPKGAFNKSRGSSSK